MSDSPLRLNLGSGPSAIRGWINIDRSPGIMVSRLPGPIQKGLRASGLIPREQASVVWPSGVRRLDVTKGLPFDDCSVEAIYSSHMLEHLTRDAARRLLAECRRTLKPDGVLRVVLPDLRRLAESYLASEEPDAADTFLEETMLGQHERLTGRAALVQLVGGSAHRWMFDAASIRHRCLQYGFSATQECAFRQGRCPDIDSLDSASRRNESIYVEAYA